MVVTAVAIAVLTPVGLGRGQVPPSEVARLNAQVSDLSATGTTAASDISAAPATSTPAPARIVVIGDSDTGGTEQGGNDAAGWPALLEEKLPDVQVDSISAGGAGYVARDPESGQTLVQVAGKAPLPGAAAVIVFGSRNDGPGVAQQVAEGARATFETILQRAPGTKLIVIGPFWLSATVPARVRSNSDAIRTTATAEGARFVDPLQERWFLDQPDLIGTDGRNLNDAGHVYLANQMEPVVRKALGL